MKTTISYLSSQLKSWKLWVGGKVILWTSKYLLDESSSQKLLPIQYQSRVNFELLNQLVLIERSRNRCDDL